MRIYLLNCSFLIEILKFSFLLNYSLLSLSALSSEFEMVQPQLIESEDGHIQIEKGRHILMQLVAEQFNPNSTYLGEKTGAKRINIISGPNSSGKSVYLMVSFIWFLKIGFITF